MRLLAALLAVGLAVPATASSAPPWSEPLTVAKGRPLVGYPQVVYRTQGGGAVMWATRDNRPPGVYAAPLGHGGRPGARRRVSPGDRYFALEAVVAGRRFVTVTTGLDSRSRTILYAGKARTPGETIRRTRIRVSRGGFSAAAAADSDRGGAIVFGTQSLRRGHAGRVFLAPRAGTSRGYRPPVAISRRGRVRSVGAAANARGDVLAVWQRADRVEARLKHASGRLGPPLLLGRTRSVGSQIGVALGHDGRAVVAWLDEQAGLARSRARIFVTTRTSSREFGSPTVLERFPDSTRGGYVLAVSAGRRAIVAWTGRHAVRAVFVEGHRIGDAQDLGPLPDRTDGFRGALFDLAATSDGAAVAVWVEPRPESIAQRLMAAPLAPGAPAFGAAEEVADASRLGVPPSAAIDPLDGTAVVAWREAATTLRGRERIVVATRPEP